MSPTFRRGPSERAKSESPERLFDDLPRTRDGIPNLWSHQADVLREYADSYVDAPDVAFELPTGAGKTLPSLLIAEWRRSSFGERVAYVCPTVQLANQVQRQAIRQGIPAVALHGSHKLWDTSDAVRFDSGRSLAVTTYSTIFNLKPALSQPACILFDDAHAAEQYVASAWSLSIRRAEHPDAYAALLGAVANDLSGIQVQQLRDKDPDPNTRLDVRILPIDALRRRATAIDHVLAALGGDLKFRYTMIRPALDRCIFYFGWDGFLIRPFIPPTGHHQQFADAQQRIYISATLGDGGELERAFGRRSIARVPVPAGWDQRASGRRFFVFPELLKNVDATSIAKRAIELAGKALVITPSGRTMDERLPALLPAGFPSFGSADFEKSLETFRTADKGVLAVANRYDGIDLADEACRLTILDGLPNAEHLQERFLIRSLRAGRVLEERLRTRVIQGAGRSTRGLKDYSAVVILGDDLTRFLLKDEVRAALRAEAQAEISFGIENSEVPETELWTALRSFLAQDDTWQTEAEPILADMRRESSRRLPSGTDVLAATASKEVKAWAHVWDGNYRAAGQDAVEIAQHLASTDLTPYRAFWLYLAASWQQAAAEADLDDALARSARELLRKAQAAARGMAWLRVAAPTTADEVDLEPVDTRAIDAVANHPARSMPMAKWLETCRELEEGLSATDHRQFEKALTILGGLLGAQSSKPSGKGRADSVWIFHEFWVSLEAKSETTSTGPVDMSEVRQANTQLKSVSGDRGEAVPPGSISLIISPKQLTDPDAAAIAEPHLYLCSPADMQSLARDVIEAWRTIRAEAMNVSPQGATSAIQQALSDRQVLPTSVRERVTGVPIRGGT